LGACKKGITFVHIARATSGHELLLLFPIDENVLELGGLDEGAILGNSGPMLSRSVISCAV
jgi:hypothetical protein